MSILIRRGDLFDDPAEALVNPVNAVGVMGAGLAKEFRARFPANYRAYLRACKSGHVAPGRMFVYDYGAGRSPRYIINFPTKRHWKDPSRMADIESGLAGLRRTLAERAIASVALPALGAGLGGLDWPGVRRRIEDSLGGLDGVAVTAYGPLAGPEAAPAEAPSP